MDAASEHSGTMSPVGTPVRGLQAVVQALGKVSLEDYEALTDSRRVLSQGAVAQEEFIQAGGAKALAQVLRHESAMLQKKAMKSFLLIATPTHAKAIMACGALDMLLESFATLKAESRRKELCGKILKRMMGIDVVISDDNASSLAGSGRLGESQRREEFPTRSSPVPWFGVPGSMDRVAWDQEIVCTLVDGVLMSGNTPSNIRAVAERAISKLLSMQNHTRKVIVDKQLMDDLIASIRGLSSSAEALMKVATCFTIMHASNEVTFVRCGGLEALVEAAASDSNGNVGGEVAAWCLYQFARTGAENSKEIAEAGGVEALVQLLYSPECSARMAAGAALLAMLKHDAKQDQVKVQLVEANAIPGLISALQDVSGNANTAVMVLLVLREISRVSYYKQEILAAGAKETLEEVSQHPNHDVADLARRLLKHITKKSIRQSLLKALGMQRAPPSRQQQQQQQRGGKTPGKERPGGHIHFDFDLEKENAVLDRASSNVGERVRNLLRRSNSFKSEKGTPIIAVPPAAHSRRFSTPDPQRVTQDYRTSNGMLGGKKGPRSVASERGGYAPSLGAWSQASSNRSNKSAMLSANTLKELAKINGSSNDQDPFSPLRSKFGTSSKGLSSHPSGGLAPHGSGGIGAYPRS